MVAAADTMRRGLLRNCLYSPEAMDRSSLATLFVGRDSLMEDVLGRVTASISGQEKHHVLLVGPRGCGKTHFLALAGHLLDDWLAANQARDKATVIQLREEEWGIASYLDFVVRILQALARQQNELEAEIARVHELFAANPQAAEAAAAGLLRQCVRGRTLVLFCENLAELLAGLGRAGQQKWRSAIQEDGNWAIVASTPAMSSAFSRQDGPFYGFFAIRSLEKLDPETGLELLIKKASHEGKEDVARFLRTPVGRARARAIHHFSGGNHRVYGILFDFFDRQTLEELVAPFMQMADGLTPYYQDRMRVLPPAQRKIVEFLTRATGAVTVKDIAASCLMMQQTAAKQISELVARGYVVSRRLGRNAFCELAEPLMRICAQIKDNRAEHCSLFVEFLRHWFAVRDLEQRRARIDSDLDSVHVREALRCFHADRREPLLEALEDDVEQHLQNENYEEAAKALESTLQHHDTECNHETLVYAWVEAGKSGPAVATGRRAAQKHPQNANVHYWLARAHLLKDDFASACEAIEKAASLDCEHSPSLCLSADILLGLGRFEEAIAKARKLLDREPDHWHSLQQIIEASVRLNRIDEARLCAEQLVRQVCERRLLPPDREADGPGRKQSQTLLDVAGFLLGQQLAGPALQLIDRVRTSKPSARWHELRGRALLDMEDYDGASRELRKSAARAPKADTYCQLATALLASGKWKQAITAAQRLTAIDPQHVYAHYVCAEALNELGRSKEALAAYDLLVPTAGVNLLMLAAERVRAMGEFAAAGRYLKRVAELQPDSRELWIERIRLGFAEGNTDSVLASAERLADLPGGALLGRLFAAQVQAADQKPEEVLAALAHASGPEGLKGDRLVYVEAITGIVTAFVRKCGPGRLAGWISDLRKRLGELLDEAMMVGILRELLYESVGNGFAGDLEDWRQATDGLKQCLADMPACRVSVGFIDKAAEYAKTDDSRCLLELPLEQRRLLKEVFSKAPF